MNLLNKITTKNLKLNRKRTIVTIIGIILSVALITTVASVYSSIIQSSIEYEVSIKGDYHVAYHDVPISDLDSFRNDESVTKMSVTQNLGYADIETKNEYKPYAFVKAYTKDALNNITSRLVEGRLPENENEIVIPTHLKTNGRNFLKVGDTVTLNIGERVNEAGEVLTQGNPYGEDESSQEKIINTTAKEYKVVGVVERPARNIEPSDAPGYTFVTYIDGNALTDKVDVYLRYTKEAAKNLEKNIGGSKYEYDFNQYLILLETDPGQAIGGGVLDKLVYIVYGIIVFASVFCIKNSFDISITERIKQYGMIRSIGATRKQIRKSVFHEATILGIIGIPLGILLGYLATFILVLVCQYFMRTSSADTVNLMAFFSPMSIVAAVVLGIITIYFSALRSAVRASKVSPIDSIRNSAGIKINAKKVRSPKIIKKLFGIGGEISYKNLKRNKKKYRTTVISIIVSVSIFIALSSFMSMMFSAVEDELKVSEYNVYMSCSPHGDMDRYNKFVSTTGHETVDEYTIFRALGYYDDIYAVGEEQYSKYIKKLGLKYDDIKDKAISIGDGKVGDKVQSETFDETLQIGYVTDEKPFGVSDIVTPCVIISDELFDKLLPEQPAEIMTIYYHSTDADKLQDDIEELLNTETHYFLRNIEESVRQRRDLVTLVGIFLYGFIIVISLIGVTNIFNTITTNMELRKPEFAMLRSVGMTTKEFNRMIRLETVFMGAKSLLFGTAIGTALSYVLYVTMYGSQDYGTAKAFSFPLIPIMIAVLAVFILISMIMNYSIAKIKKQNTIETIRNENI